MAMKDYNGFTVSQNVIFFIIECLLIVWAIIDDSEIDLTSIGFGHVDPFMLFFGLWPIVVFITIYAVHFLRRKSKRYLAGSEKGTLISLSPVNEIGENFEKINGKPERVHDNIGNWRCGGTSKPKIPGLGWTKLVATSKNYCFELGGYLIIMSKMRPYRGKEHDSLPPHIQKLMTTTPGFIRYKTRVLSGEQVDTKWAVKSDDGWVITDDFSEVSISEKEEAYNKSYSTEMTDLQNQIKELDKRGIKVDDTDEE